MHFLNIISGIYLLNKEQRIGKPLLIVENTIFLPAHSERVLDVCAQHWKIDHSLLPFLKI